MIYGLDCTAPPTQAQATELMALGFTFMNVYIGGPRAAAGRMGWPNADVGHNAAAGFIFIPTYVGRNQPWDARTVFTFDQGVTDGGDADVLTGACGFNSTTILCLDVEYGTWQQYGQAALDYMDGWCQQVHAAGHPTMIYSDEATMNAAGFHFDWQWVAFPTGHYSGPEAPTWDVAQVGYCTLAGVSMDINIAGESFPFASYTPPA